MTAIKSSISFDIITKYHKFKSWSQLAEEAKGGYLEGFVQIAPEVTKVELALYSKDGDSIPCLLFVTPHKKELKVSPIASDVGVLNQLLLRYLIFIH